MWGGGVLGEALLVGLKKSIFPSNTLDSSFKACGGDIMV